MNKDLIRGYLIAMNAPKEILDALNDNESKQSASSITVGEAIDAWHPTSIQSKTRLINALINEGVLKFESDWRSMIFDEFKNKVKSLGNNLHRDYKAHLLRTPNFGRKSLNDLLGLMGEK